ncbi:MAG: Gfo/Idh/MocA family oxidoreductase [Candidatus Brocadiia bacterium]
MAKYSVGLIGTGVRRREDGTVRFGMNAHHARGYQELPELCELVACADIKPANAERFAQEFGIPRTYTDYEQMLAQEELDIVSISTWTPLHADMVVTCAGAGLQAIHCEKPMATTWGDCKRMAAACEEADCRLTFNHQRRFGKPFRMIRDLIREGRVGEVRRLEFTCSNLYDWGTHQFNMMGMFNGERPATWAMAQVDYRTERLIFNTHNVNSAIAVWQYDNGVHGFCATGGAGDAMGAFIRVLGTDGIIEMCPAGDDMPTLRILGGGSGWEKLDTEGESIGGGDYVSRAIRDVVTALDQDGRSELCAENALRSTEIIFACYESVRRRGRLELPLQIEDNPLVAMVESGELSPRPRD